MIETINGKAYLKVGDKVYELGGGSNIITADSVEQLPDPASVPEGTIAFVPSEEEEGGGGLPVVTTTVQPAQSGAGPDVNGYLTADENALVDAIGANPFLLCFPIVFGGKPVKMTALLTPITIEYEGTTAVMWYGGTVAMMQGVLTITLRQEDFGVYNLFYYEAK